jgi:hypothetical protein
LGPDYPAAEHKKMNVVAKKELQANVTEDFSGPE